MLHPRLLWPPNHTNTLAHQETARGRTPQCYSGLQLFSRCPEIPINHVSDRPEG